MIDAKTRLGAKRFLAEYFGFDITILHICGIKKGRDGRILVLQFQVNAPALDEPAEYASIFREDMQDWELKRLSQKE